MIDVVSGGASVDKTSVAARNLIENMAANSQQFTTRQNSCVIKNVSEVQVTKSSKLQHKLDELTSIVKQLASMQNSVAASLPLPPSIPGMLCGICSATDHYTDSCPTLQESDALKVMQVPTMPKEKEDLSCTVARVDQHGEEKIQEQPESMPAQPKEAKNVERAIHLSFPQKVIQPSKKIEEAEKEILETFKKVEVNIPLLDAIKQILKYAKFLKDLCTHRRCLKGNEKVNMGMNISALFEKLKSTMLKKCKDPGTSTIPCIIGNNRIKNVMLDLGASINSMPLSIFTSLSLGPLQPTGVVIQLANRSITNAVGIVEDVLVKVNDLIFPATFYILDMQKGVSMKSVEPIILGRPFLKTARTKIDVQVRTLTMEFGDNIVRFNILDTMKHPSEEHYVFQIDFAKSLPFVEQHPILELKPLLEHLKYVHLGENEKLSVIIYTKMNIDQEERLLEVIKRHKKAIGWTLGDILGISPSLCMHRILLEEVLSQ
ncbi:uncharacterized protein LOC113870083 [Abrus precatorius]|uniref:Uncharacterized protein LOC113870083 n=1 Tax=Abrus precatorius TaxID=3816 RepID=A0A8B8M3E7_ABRPR|nr:uncharacterized protein LOC113870083 [Abrus precatorius]